jgi:hypothetical protein
MCAMPSSDHAVAVSSAAIAALEQIRPMADSGNRDK